MCVCVCVTTGVIIGTAIKCADLCLLWGKHAPQFLNRDIFLNRGMVQSCEARRDAKALNAIKLPNTYGTDQLHVAVIQEHRFKHTHTHTHITWHISASYSHSYSHSHPHPHPHPHTSSSCSLRCLLSCTVGFDFTNRASRDTFSKIMKIAVSTECKEPDSSSTRSEVPTMQTCIQAVCAFRMWL